LAQEARSTDQATTSQSLEITEFKTYYATHYPQQSRRFLNFLVIPNFGASTPNWKIALNIQNTPSIPSITGQTHQNTKLYNPFTERGPDMFFTSAALQSKFEFDG